MTGKSRLSRLLKHLLTTESKVADLFSETCFSTVESAIVESEKSHSCEIAFIVEGSLSPKQIWANCTAAERAREMFGRFGVWDTALNNGILIYVLVADRSVHIIVDRGLTGSLDAVFLRTQVDQLTASFRLGNYTESMVKAVSAITTKVQPHYPAKRTTLNENELPDRPLRF